MRVCYGRTNGGEEVQERAASSSNSKNFGNFGANMTDFKTISLTKVLLIKIINYTFQFVVDP